MGFIYKIEVVEECYIGSTKNKYLCNRQYSHNYNMKNNNTSHLYNYCREHNVKKIICEKIEEVDNENSRIKEQEYINKLKPTLNTHRAYQTHEERQEQLRIKNNKKTNCPICNKSFNKFYVKKHIQRKHNI